MNNMSDRLNELVDSFVSQVNDVVRQQAMEILGNSMSGSKVKVKPSKTPMRLAGDKRSAEDIDKRKAEVYAYVEANPGQRVEQINAALKASPKELTLPIKKLLAEGKLRTEGRLRATAYFVGDGEAKPKAAKKAKAKPAKAKKGGKKAKK